MTGSKVQLATRDGAVYRYRHLDLDNVTFHWYMGTQSISVVRAGQDIDGIRINARIAHKPTETEIAAAIEQWAQENG